jgi:hypothetical protein
MTETEWLTGTNPKPLLGYLFARVPGRSQKAPPDERFRRFGIACCRRLQRVLGAGDRCALDYLDAYARDGRREALLSARRSHKPDGDAASHALSNSRDKSREERLLAEARALATSAVWSCTKGKPTQAAMAYLEAARSAESIRLADTLADAPQPGADWQPPSPAELAVQCDFLRCIFGNPFRRASLTAAWVTPTVMQLAAAVYDEPAFAALPILADALEDAGCTDQTILHHCRGPQLHVRGCWVVEALLAKG